MYIPSSFVISEGLEEFYFAKFSLREGYLYINFNRGGEKIHRDHNSRKIYVYNFFKRYNIKLPMTFKAKAIKYGKNKYKIWINVN